MSDMKKPKSLDPMVLDAILDASGIPNRHKDKVRRANSAAAQPTGSDSKKGNEVVRTRGHGSLGHTVDYVNQSF